MSRLSSENPQSWLLPPRKTALAPGLYLVATPIGNLGDITLRALDTLAGADLVACEDTRITGRLLTHFGLKKPLLVYNDHTGDSAEGAGLRRIIEALKAGKIVALVSDAGTPLISDPGYRLVRACAEAGLPVTVVPGAGAGPSALQLSALPTDRFAFGGFLPPKSTARRKVLTEWQMLRATLVFFETGPRLAATLRDMHEVLGVRDVAIARELTKMFEEIRRMTLAEAANFYESAAAPKGEIVLVVGGATDEPADAQDIDALLRRALKTMGTKEAAAFVAAQTGAARKALYARALALGKKETSR